MKGLRMLNFIKESMYGAFLSALSMLLIMATLNMMNISFDKYKPLLILIFIPVYKGINYLLKRNKEAIK
jgi:hypothetical protein